MTVRPDQVSWMLRAEHYVKNSSAPLDQLGVFVDPDESEDEDILIPSTSGTKYFNSRQQVFIVQRISKAVSGFRPSVICDGFLADERNTTSGRTFSPLGRDQRLSFKYEPPSPKFSLSTERVGCVSYHLQLLHGSQFLYSLRGLPKVLRCRRAAKALEWGPVQLVFSASSDLATFLATLKYVELLEMGVSQCCDRFDQVETPMSSSPTSYR